LRSYKELRVRGTNAAKKGCDEFKIAMQSSKKKGKRRDLRVQTKLMKK
jgi:hypothetical protein